MDHVTILGGPVFGSGYWWYRVRLPNGMTLNGGITGGWVVAEDHDGNPWIQTGGCEVDPLPPGATTEPGDQPC